MLNEYPIIMNNVVIPFFPEVENTPNKIENENQSEGGKKIVQLIREDVMSISVKLSVAGVDWVKFFYELNLMDGFVLKQYSPLTEAYNERTVRMTKFKYKVRKKSETLGAVNGVWDLSFDLEEF